MFLLNKAFFFFAYEGIKDPVSSAATRTILTPSARGGTLIFPRAVAGDPFTNGALSCPSGAVGSNCTISNILTFAQQQGFAGIPSSINPIIQEQVLSVLPATGNFTGVGDGLNTTGYRFNRSADTTRHSYTGRGDVDLTRNDSVSFIYNWNKEDNLRPDVDPTGYSVIPDASQFAANEQVTIAYKRIIGSSFANDFRFGKFENEVPFDRTSDYPSYYISTGLATTTGTLPLGISSPVNIFMDQGRNNKVITFSDNATWSFSNHSIKFGGLYQKYEVNSYNDYGIVPHYYLGTTAVDAATNTTFTNDNFSNVGVRKCNRRQSALPSQWIACFAWRFGFRLDSSIQYADITTGYVSGVRQLAPQKLNHALFVGDSWQVSLVNTKFRRPLGNLPGVTS